jgi:hypothetical protein
VNLPSDLRLDFQPAPPSNDALEKARAAMAAEAKGPRRAGWQTNVLRGAAVLLGVVALVMIVLIATGSTTLDLITARLVTVTTVLTVGIVATWAALRPQGRRERFVALGMVVVSALLLVALRGDGAPSDLPPWVCTASHLGVGLAPAAFVLLLLRGMAPNGWRSLVAGLAAGTTGAAVGEFGCAQSAGHVAVFHLSAWVAISIVVWLVSRKLGRTSYAP